MVKLTLIAARMSLPDQMALYPSFIYTRLTMYVFTVLIRAVNRVNRWLLTNAAHTSLTKCSFVLAHARRHGRLTEATYALPLRLKGL